MTSAASSSSHAAPGCSANPTDHALAPTYDVSRGTSRRARFPFKSEFDLPALSVNQAVAVCDIKDWGKGEYTRFANGHWLPANGDALGSAIRKGIRQTDRTILSLIRNGYLQVKQSLNGRPVRVRLTFP